MFGTPYGAEPWSGGDRRITPAGGNRGNQHVARITDRNSATAADVGLSLKEIHEARQIRDDTVRAIQDEAREVRESGMKDDAPGGRDAPATVVIPNEAEEVAPPPESDAQKSIEKESGR